MGVDVAVDVLGTIFLRYERFMTLRSISVVGFAAF